MEMDVVWRREEDTTCDDCVGSKRRRRAAPPARFYRGKRPRNEGAADIHWQHFLERTAKKRAAERASLKRLVNPRLSSSSGTQIRAFWSQAPALTFLRERQEQVHGHDQELRLWAQELSKTGKRRFIAATAEHFFLLCCSFP